MCGNAIRCVAKHVIEKDILSLGDRSTLRIDTRAGEREPLTLLMHQTFINQSINQSNQLINHG